MAETKSNPLSAIGGSLDKLQSSIDKSIIAPINSLNSITKSIADIPNRFKNIADAFKSLNEDGKVSLSELGGAFSSVSANIGGLKESLTNINGAMKVLKTPMGALVAVFAYLYTTNEDFRNSINELVSTVISSLKPIMESLKNLFAQIGPMIGDLAGKLATMLIPIIQMLIPIIGEILAAIVPIITIIIDAASSILPLLVSAFMPLLDVFMSLMNIILPIIIPIIQMVADMFSDNLSSAVSLISGVLENVLMPILDTIKKAIEFFCKLFKGDFKGALESARGYFISFANSVIGVFAIVVQSIINGFANFINFFVDMINGVIGMINKIPGVNINLIGKVDWSNATSGWKLPAMATGGVVSAPTTALIGEGKYPEAVVPLGNSPQFATMKNDIASAVMQGIMAMGGINNKGHNSGTEVVLNIDGEKLARTIIPAMERENRRKGFSMQVREV